MHNQTLKVLTFVGLFVSVSTSQHAGPCEWYKATKKNYAQLSRPTKIALKLGAVALASGAIYYALQKNEGKIYNDIVEGINTKIEMLKIKVNALYESMTELIVKDLKETTKKEIFALEQRISVVEKALKEYEIEKAFKALKECEKLQNNIPLPINDNPQIHTNLENSAPVYA